MERLASSTESPMSFCIVSEICWLRTVFIRSSRISSRCLRMGASLSLGALAGAGEAARAGEPLAAGFLLTAAVFFFMGSSQNDATW